MSSRRKAANAPTDILADVRRKAHQVLDVWLDGQQAQRRPGWIHIPGRIEGGDRLDPAVFSSHDQAVSQGKNLVDRAISQGDRDIGIVIVQIGETAAHLPKETFLRHRIRDLYRQNIT